MRGALWFSLILAFPGPGGGRLGSIVMAKTMGMSEADVYIFALVTPFVTVGLALTALILISRHRLRFTGRFQLIRQHRGRRVWRQLRWTTRPVVWFTRRLAAKARQLEAKTVAKGRQAQYRAIAQLPFFPNGLLGSIALTHRWRLPALIAVPLIAVASWCSFSLFYLVGRQNWLYLVGMLAAQTYVFYLLERRASRTNQATSETC